MSADLVPLELAEIGAFTDLYRSATPEIAEQCGIVVRELDDGVVMAAAELDVLALNRAVGLGLTRRPSDEVLAHIVDAFREIASPRYFVQVAPTEHAGDLTVRLEALGMRHYNNWMRLRRSLTDLPATRESALRVERVGPEHADPFSHIVAGAFGYPPAISPLTGCVIGRPGWHHYLAYEADEPIGAAAMFVAGEAAWFGFAATKAEHRGRGAQTSLVVRRLRDAASEGCRWVSVETAEQTPEHEAPSFRNLTRLGFTVAYRRANYLWTPA